MSTAYHARYFAHELTRQRPASGLDRLSMSLFDACVDLNPHQIDAAMFALQSPLSKGVLLADEVGLGKTIEAGLILCQLWAERRRRLLVVCPAALRKQWSSELEEKFNLPTGILDAPAYRQAQRNGTLAPFDSDRRVITSVNFASAMQRDLRVVAWDLVIIDEAHKLRNAYRPSNKMGQRLRWALEDRRKVLLTATPLQNSLLELYGLSTLIDEHLFGDIVAFRAQYMRQDSDVSDLRHRLATFTKRTLRNQVAEYIQYTERRPITRPFHPTDNEHRLYEAISAFLLRENTYSIPTRQRSLTTLILRKLLASSSNAIAGTMETMQARLIALRDGLAPEDDLVERIINGDELEDEYLDDALGDDNDDTPPADDPPIDPHRLQAEIDELGRYSAWARSIGVDTKSRSLVAALEIGFGEMARMGAQRKALIFTESRRTQQYLKAFLEANGYAGKLVLFNGTNADAESRAIYERWLHENKATGRVTNSRAVDIRTALIEQFRDHAEIMIATEAAAEGVNLQFCSLVINYDLPWNPQRIEQRTGRCHRYGQKHDVVVINFLNERNEADRRVLELLTEKFHLFNGVFGASDDVLGTIESGVDFEKRILSIYQQCRTTAEIEAAFKQLRTEMDAVITARMDETRRALLEHFDEDVHARLKAQLNDAREQLDQVGRMFWALTRYALQSEGAQIIQLFGRGVRLKGFEFSLKRSRKIQEEQRITVPPRITTLETLNIFGIRADYMRHFKEYLEEEGLPAQRVEFVLPVIKDRHLAHLHKLRTIRVKPGIDFKKQGPKPTLRRPAAAEKMSPVLVDWYPKLQSARSKGIETNGDAAVKNEEQFREQHIAFMDLDAIFFELQQLKNERAWYNLNLSRAEIETLLLTGGWYKLLIPAEELAFTRFDRVRVWQEIAITLLKKYCDKYYKYRKSAYEMPHLEYRTLSADDANFIDEYRFLIDESEEALIEKLKQLKQEIEARNLQDVEHGSFHAFNFDRHLYEPLIHFKSSVIDVRPVELNEGERDFVLDLRAFYEKRRLFFQDKELYLLRNRSRGSGIGFFEAGNFYPDFLLWLLVDGRQYVTFVDPKGIRNLQGFDDPKINFYRTIKDLEARLADPAVVLHSFIISNTPYVNVAFWEQQYGMNKAEFERRHVLFQKDDRQTYIGNIMDAILNERGTRSVR